jgi:transposase
VCLSCGHAMNADHNAALNIRSRARVAVNRPMAPEKRRQGTPRVLNTGASPCL